MKKEYTLNHSPFHNKKQKLRASLSELTADNGEDIVLARKRFFKKDEYVKFIINDEFDISSFDKLSKLSITLLYYILYNCLEYNILTFRLKASTVSKILNKDVSNIHKAIRELCNIKYIAKTDSKEVYWINHNYFYKGNFIVDKYVKQKN